MEQSKFTGPFENNQLSAKHWKGVGIVRSCKVAPNIIEGEETLFTSNFLIKAMTFKIYFSGGPNTF